MGAIEASKSLVCGGIGCIPYPADFETLGYIEFSCVQRSLDLLGKWVNFNRCVVYVNGSAVIPIIKGMLNWLVLYVLYCRMGIATIPADRNGFHIGLS